MNPSPFHRIEIPSDADAVAAAAARHLVAALRENSGRPAVCLTGGSGPQKLYALLATPSLRNEIPWNRTHWFIGDERFMAPSDPLNNMRAARQLFLDRCSPASHIHPIPTDGAPDTAAQAYASELHSFYGSTTHDPARPLFDVVLMGVGPDGHTASLFPNADALSERERWVVGVAKANVAPFVPRVTLTLPALASCKSMLFLATGPEKRAVLERLTGVDDLPAARAANLSNALWLIDRAAAPAILQPTSTTLRAIVIMGVSGSGKSTIGRRLAERMGFDFLDSDDLHPDSNIAKMKRGEPLSDEDRAPWLKAIAGAIERRPDDVPPLIIACSVLKRAYRKILIGDRSDIRLVYLKGGHDLIAGRFIARRGHFMSSSLLDDQFAALEPPSSDEHAIVVDVGNPLVAIVDQLARQLSGDVS